MPYDNLPESDWPAMDRCVESVMADGKDKQAAIAICYTSITGKSIDTRDFKIGATISRATMSKLQAAHDALAELGACPMDDTAAPDEMEPPDTEKSVVAMGGLATKCVKMDDGWHVRLPLVVFTNPNEPDLTGVDYFDQSTDFDMDFPGKSTAYFQHGMDKHFGLKRLKPVTLTKDDFAVWADGILSEVDEYEKFLIELGKAGKLGMSSGVPGHLVEREPVGKAMHIKYWPLGKDASYTHTPAEPKTRRVIPLKSLIMADEPEALDGARAKAASNIVPELDPVKEESTMLTEDEIKAIAKEMADEMKRSAPATANAGASRVEVVKDAADQKFSNAGEYFKAVKNAAISPNTEDVRLRSLKAAAGMSEGVPADGGYLVPQEYASGIIDTMLSTGDVLSRVNMVNVTGNNMTWNAIDETSRASSRYGGVVGYWLNEAGTKTASSPKFRQLELKLKKVIALAYATDELLADASALAGWLNGAVPEELRFQTEAAMIYGDGVGKPLGILSSPALVSALRVDANKIQAADIVTMYSRRLGSNFVWYINPEAVPQLLNLNSTYQYLFVPAGAWSDAPQARLLGYPVIESEYCSALGTAGDIILADMGQYQAIQQGGVEAASSIHVKFTTDESAFRWVYRVDGAPVRSAPLTPHKGSATRSPFVTLAAASA